MRTYVAESVRPPTRITLRHGTMAPPLCATMLATCSAISLCSVAAIALPSMRLEGADMLAGRLACVRACVRARRQRAEGRKEQRRSVGGMSRATKRQAPILLHSTTLLAAAHSRRITNNNNNLAPVQSPAALDDRTLHETLTDPACECCRARTDHHFSSRMSPSTARTENAPRPGAGVEIVFLNEIGLSIMRGETLERPAEFERRCRRGVVAVESAESPSRAASLLGDVGSLASAASPSADWRRIELLRLSWP
mgnify:FL=1